MYEATPQVDADGNYLGSSVGTRQQLHRGSVDSESDYFEDEFGQTHHVMEDVSLEDDSQPNDYDDDEYIGLLYEVHPQLNDAVAWSHQNFTADEADWYNQMIDSDDLDDVNAAVEFLLDKFGAELSEEESEEYEDTEDTEEETDDPNDQAINEWFEGLDDSVIDTEVDSILDSNYTEDDVAVMEAASNGYDEGTIHHEILSVGQQIASGHVTPEEAINYVLDQYGEAKATAAYIEIKQLINEHFS